MLDTHPRHGLQSIRALSLLRRHQEQSRRRLGQALCSEWDAGWHDRRLCGKCRGGDADREDQNGLVSPSDKEKARSETHALTYVHKYLRIDDAKGSKRFRSTFHGLQMLVREQGLLGLYRGLVPTTIKQSATSAVRMGSYNALKEGVKANNLPLNSATTFGIGSLAGVITVYATQPFDTVKTRVQSAAGSSTKDALASLLREAGVRGLWKGSTMRLGRLVFSGGIVFSVYERVAALLSSTSVVGLLRV